MKRTGRLGCLAAITLLWLCRLSSAEPVASALDTAAPPPAVALSSASAPALPALKPGQAEPEALRDGLAAARLRLRLNDPFGAGRPGPGGPEPVPGVPLEWVRGMIEGDRKAPSEVRRSRQGVRRDGFAAATRNPDVVERHTDAYSLRLPMGPISDQKQSSRCWIFAGVNMLRSRLIADGAVSNSFQFSQNYLHFFYLLEQAGEHLDEAAKPLLRRTNGAEIGAEALRRKLKAEIDTGGWFQYFSLLVEKYGLVPKGAMRETASSTDPEALVRELRLSLASATDRMLSLSRRESAASRAEIQQVKARALEDVWRVLATHLGTPPKDFRHTPRDGEPKRRSARYTPRQFAEKVVGFRPEDYVDVASLPRKHRGAAYEMEAESLTGKPPIRFLNVGIERLRELVITSVKGGHAVWFSADSGKDVDSETGIMHPRIFRRDAAYGRSPAKAPLSRSRRTFLGVGEADHAMAITGLDQPEPGGPVVKFQVENSWGASEGSGGIFHMYSEWFDQNVYDAVIHVRYLSDAERRAWAAKAKRIRGNRLY